MRGIEGECIGALNDAARDGVHGHRRSAPCCRPKWTTACAGVTVWPLFPRSLPCPMARERERGLLWPARGASDPTSSPQKPIELKSKSLPLCLRSSVVDTIVISLLQMPQTSNAEVCATPPRRRRNTRHHAGRLRKSPSGCQREAPCAVLSETKDPCSYLNSQLPRFFAASKMVLPEAPWSAVAAATAFSFEFHGGSFAAALQGAARIFMVSACRSRHERPP